MMTKHIIDTDILPSIIPDGWTIKEHRRGGQIEWDREKVSLYLNREQKAGEHIWGHDLRRELAYKPVLNACVLDYLLANPHLIPDEWRGDNIFFWGTIYRRSDDGLLYVLCLVWRGPCWVWNYRLLGNGWRSNSPALLSQVEGC